MPQRKVSGDRQRPAHGGRQRPVRPLCELRTCDLPSQAPHSAVNGAADPARPPENVMFVMCNQAGTVTNKASRCHGPQSYRPGNIGPTSWDTARRRPHTSAPYAVPDNGRSKRGSSRMRVGSGSSRSSNTATVQKVVQSRRASTGPVRWVVQASGRRCARPVQEAVSRIARSSVRPFRGCASAMTRRVASETGAPAGTLPWLDFDSTAVDRIGPVGQVPRGSEGERQRRRTSLRSLMP